MLDPAPARTDERHQHSYREPRLASFSVDARFDTVLDAAGEGGHARYVVTGRLIVNRPACPDHSSAVRDVATRGNRVAVNEAQLAVLPNLQPVVVPQQLLTLREAAHRYGVAGLQPEVHRRGLVRRAGVGGGRALDVDHLLLGGRIGRGAGGR